MESYLLTPNNNRLIGIKYYDIYDAAKQIVEGKIKADLKLKSDFEEFSKNYNHYGAYLDFLIIKLGFKFVNPFILEEGILYGLNGELHYKDIDNANEYIYPKSDDISLHINHFNIDNFSDSLIDPEGITYTLDRNKSEFHGLYYEIILMNKLTQNKVLYDDYISCMNENSMIYYAINAYFRDRLGYLQVVKYPDNSGHILLNDDLKSSYIDGIIAGIKEMYPKINIEKSNLPEHLIDSALEMKEEASDINVSRRI